MRDYDIGLRTVGRLLTDKAARIGERPFLHCAGQSYSYAWPDEMTNRYANGLGALGVGRGTHTAVIPPNGLEFCWTIWGLAKLRAVGVPLNTSAERRQPTSGAAGTRTGGRAS